MDLIDRLNELAARFPKQLEYLKTEEATKNALVMPFLNALGYNVFDPTVVVPEYTADVGTKKGEKVDYAILDGEGKPILLIECKTADVNLDQAHASQLYRYFSVTPARFGVLTNGVQYRFFSDLEEPNKMDSRPFLEFSMLEVTVGLARELKKFTREGFDLENILSTASELKYTKGMKKVLAEEWANPSPDLVKILTSRVYSGRLTQVVRDQFTEITKKALAEFLSERVKDRLQSALQTEVEPARAARAGGDEPEDGEEPESGIVTTDEEWQGYYAVKAILSPLVDPSRVSIRDRKRYCAVLLDDTNRKPICRFYFNTPQKYLALFDVQKNEEKHAIEGLNDLFQHAEALRFAVQRYDGMEQQSKAIAPSPSTPQG